MNWEKILTMLAAAAGFVAGLFGEWTAAMTVLVVLMVVDYITGCFCGFLGKSTKTETGHWLSSTAFPRRPRLRLKIAAHPQLRRRLRGSPHNPTPITPCLPSLACRTWKSLRSSTRI